MRKSIALVAVVATLGNWSLVGACSLCVGTGANRQTLREDAKQARLVLFGTLANAKPNGSGTGGTTDLHIESVIKADTGWAGHKVITLPKYVPVDTQKPQRFLVFCDIVKGQLDPYRGFAVKSADVVEYLKTAMSLRPDDASAALKFFFGHLGNAESEIANDAFLEFARANDRDVAAAAKQLDPTKLRAFLEDPQTADYKLSLFAYLLGACGRPTDADYLAGLLRKSGDRYQRALGGALSGYIQLRPNQGWKLAREIVADEKRAFPERMAVLTAMRFFRASQPEAAKGNIQQTLAIAIPQGNIADLAIEDLRRWEWWDLTSEILSQYGKKSHDSPMIKRAIVRYAICCPLPQAKALVAQIRKADDDLVKEVEEALAFERAPAASGK